jgi:hypothetical protein
MIEITGMTPEITMSPMKSNLSRSRARSARVAASATPSLRIEPVDNWHAAWQQVRELVAAVGGARKLRVDKDGWLSARQVLMVAFVGKSPAAYLSFIITPSKNGCVEARHVSHGCDPHFSKRGIESQLYHAALERAAALGCKSLRGFKLTKEWC